MASIQICQHVDCVSIFLPILLGVLLSTIGLGMVLVSSARYLSLFPDSRFRKKRALVVAVAVTQVVQTSFDVARVLLIFGAHYGDVRFFLNPRWFDALAPLFAIFIQLQTQFFLLARAHTYAGVAQMDKRIKWAGTVGLAVVILGSGACGGVTSLQIKLLGSLARLSPGHPDAFLLNWAAPVWLVSSAFIDCTLCIIIGHELLTARKAANGLSSISSQRTLDVLRRLVRVVLRSGIILAVAQTATAAVWLVEAHTAHGKISSSWVYLPMIVLPKLYTLTYLSILLAPRRNFSAYERSSGASSSTMLLTAAAPAGAGGGAGRARSAGQPYLPPLTASRRRLYPPSPISPHPYPLPYSPTFHPSSSSYSRYPRPLAPTPQNAHPVSPSYLPPLHFMHSHSRSGAAGTSNSEFAEDPYAPGGLMEEDSPVSPTHPPWSMNSSPPFFPVSTTTTKVPFDFRPAPLQLAPYTYGVVGSSRSAGGGGGGSRSGPSSASSHRYTEPHPHPYQQRSPTSAATGVQSFPPGFAPVSYGQLPLSPPLSPRPSRERVDPSGNGQGGDGSGTRGGDQFAYAPSSPISPLFLASSNPHSPSSIHPPFSPDDVTDELTHPSHPTLFSRPSKSRMFLPHPPLSTVDEGSTPPRSGGWTAEGVGAGSGRASWIPLFRGREELEVGGVREGSEEGGEDEEEKLTVLAAIPPPGSLSHDHPYAFPPSPITPRAPTSSSSPPSQHLKPLLLPLTTSPLHTPPRSPRLTERRGAVDLLPARAGVPLRMEPLEGEEAELEWPEPRTGMGRARGSGLEVNVVMSGAGAGRERRREYGMFGGGGGGKVEKEEERVESPPLTPPRPLFSHFSSPSTTTLNTLTTLSSSSFSSPAVPASASPVIPAPLTLPSSTLAARRRGLQMKHRLRPSQSSSSFGGGGGSENNDSDTTLDAVLRALRAPLPPPGLSPSPSPGQLFPPTTSSSSPSYPSSTSPPRPPVPPPPAQVQAKRPKGATHKRGRSWTERLHLNLNLTRASSESSTFGCRDAHALDRGEVLVVPEVPERVGEWEEEVIKKEEKGAEKGRDGLGEASLIQSGSSSGVERGIGAW